MNDPARADLDGIFPREPRPYANVTTAEEFTKPVEDAERIEAGRNVSHEWPKPEPLASALPAVPAFDPELLPESPCPLVEDVTHRMQTPIDFAAVVAVLSLAGVTKPSRPHSTEGCRRDLESCTEPLGWHRRRAGVTQVPGNSGRDQTRYRVPRHP